MHSRSSETYTNKHSFLDTSHEETKTYSHQTNEDWQKLFLLLGVSNHKEKRPKDFSVKKEHDNRVPCPVFLSNVPKCLPIIVGVSYLIKRRGSSRKRGATNGPCSPFLVFISKPFCLSHSIVQSEVNIISISELPLIQIHCQKIFF